MINVNGITWTKAGRTDRQIDDSTDDNIPSASRPRGRKGQCWYQTHLRFWCAEKLLNSAGYSWGVIVFTRWFDLGLAWKLIKVRQCQHWTHLRICCGKHTCKVTTWCMQFLRSYLIYKVVWLWVSSKDRKGHTKVNVNHTRDFNVEYVIPDELLC